MYNSEKIEELLGEYGLRRSVTMNELAGKVLSRPAMPRDNRELVFNRAANMESVLAQTVGGLAADQCEHCKKGMGPFVGCVVVEGAFGGAVPIATTIVVERVAPLRPRKCNQNLTQQDYEDYLPNSL
ncbi:hypothetical protein PRK78_005263 [Emydomyces testavorans]|uniref:Uncharacterized protein n=1 Tax=Emydomyces testavorans TaxID=2070801 RepID=A0AAF0DKC7_9EURO|nr:hypothetical protein PRK78_005263 [Emydomyces testavorans]